MGVWNAAMLKILPVPANRVLSVLFLAAILGVIVGGNMGMNYLLVGIGGLFVIVALVAVLVGVAIVRSSRNSPE